jgi:hypothetical protein
MLTAYPMLLVADRIDGGSRGPASIWKVNNKLIISFSIPTDWTFGDLSTTDNHIQIDPTLITLRGASRVTGTFEALSTAAITGIMTAGNIASGVVTVDPVTANVVSSVNVTGLSVKTSAGTPTADNVSILVTAISAAAALRSCTASAPTFSGSNLTGFTANIFRTNTTATGVWFLAIGR